MASELEDRDLAFDRSKHVLYTAKAKKCVQRLLRRYYNEPACEELWERIQLRYAELLEDEPALGGLKMTVSVYDPILIFAWYDVIPDKPPLGDVQQDVYERFMGGFDVLGKLFDLNRPLDNRLANLAFKRANDQRIKEIEQFPGSFRMGSYTYDRQRGIVRYSFTQCPNAEFAKRHNMQDVLPLMCNCDHMAMQKIHATLVRQGTCATADCCDYCIVGDKNPLAEEYELVKPENGLWVSVPWRS